MPARISVWVDKFAIGWEGDDTAPASHPVRALVDAMRATYPSDAHFVPYRLLSLDGQDYPDCPRLKVEALPRLAAYDLVLGYDVAVADLDHADAHAGKVAEPPQAWRDEVWALADKLCPGALLYETANGMRIVMALPHTMGAAEYQPWTRKWRQWLRDSGLPVDEISSAVACYRLPYVTRRGKLQQRRTLIREPAAFAFPADYEAVAAAQRGGIVAPDLRQPFRLPRKIPEGTRHQTLVRYAAQLRWQGLDTAQIEVQLQQVGTQRCTPAAPPAEIAEIAAWAGAQEDEKACREREQRERLATIHAPALPAEQGDTPAADAPPADDEIEPLALGDHTEIAQRLISQLQKGTPAPLVADLGEIMRYDPAGGYWRAIANHLIERLVHSYSGVDVRTTQPNGQVVWRPLKINDQTVVGVVRSMHRLLAQPGFFADAPAGTTLRDCWVRVTKQGVERLPHADWQKSIAGYDFPWTDEEPEVWHTMLRDYWGHKDSCAANIMILDEFLGATLCGIATRFQAAVALVGRGSNGKSEVLWVVRGVQAEGTVSTVSPQQFGSETYRALLAPAKLNIVGELPEKRIKQEAAAALKALVSGDEITARLLYKNPFRFKPKAGHILAANALPDVEDDSDGLFRRFIVLGFDLQFAPSGDNREIGQEVLDEDRARIVCGALHAVVALLGRGKYAVPKEALDDLTAWRMGQDEIGLFLEDCTDACEPVRGSGTDGDTLYTRYAVWAPQNGYPPVNKNRFLAAVDKRRRRFYDNGVGRRMYPVTLIR